jgi:cytochrome P450
MESMVRGLVTERIDDFVKRGEADLVADFMYQVPADVIMKLFGVPDEELPTVRQYTKRNAEFGFGYPAEEQQVELAQNMAE